jgi:hypothetical protein
MGGGGGIRRVLVALLAGIAMLASAATAEAAFPGQNGKLVFVRSGANAGDPSLMWTANPDGTGQAPVGGPGVNQSWPVWSPDGGSIAFNEHQDFNHLYTIKADGSGAMPLTEVGNWEFPTWRPDGGRLAVTRCYIFSGGSVSCRISQVNADGTDYVENFPPFPNANFYDWSPSGAKFAFAGNPSGSSASDIYTSNVDHTGAVNLTNHLADDEWPSWSADNQRIAFVSDRDGDDDIWAINADGTGLVQLTDEPGLDSGPVWSPDGTKIAFWTTRGGDGDIYVMNANGSDETPVVAGPDFDYTPDWQPIPINAYTGYARPKGATPLRVPLVVAYKNCTTPNEQHGPPLSYPSCAPPAEQSDWVTTGTADSNGQATQFVGSMRFDTVPGNPATPADEANVKVEMNITDVRRKDNMADYVGEVDTRIVMRITDRFNSSSPGGGSDPATVLDIPFPFQGTCTATADPAVGSTCGVVTSIDAIVPAAIKEGQRSIWQMGQVEVSDGGSDGSSGTVPNTIFARQGIFVP